MIGEHTTDWDEVMKGVEGKGQEDRKRDLQMYRSKCNCPPCPTYNECTKKHDELAFCLGNRSSCELTQKVCFCPGCPVHKQLDLAYMYYCMRGNEGQQRE